MLGPVHAGLLEAAHDHAGADLQALGAELDVAHARAVGSDVLHRLAGYLAVARVRAQGRQHTVQRPGLAFLAAPVGPRLGAVAVGGEEGPRDSSQLLRDVEEVRDLNRTGEHLRSASRRRRWVETAGDQLGGGHLSPQRLSDPFNALGIYAHGGQLVQQVAGGREARHCGGRARHVGHGWRQAGAGHAQRLVAGKPAPAAGAAMVIGALDGDGPRAASKALGCRPAKRAARPQEQGCVRAWPSERSALRRRSTARAANCRARRRTPVSTASKSS